MKKLTREENPFDPDEIKVGPRPDTIRYYPTQKGAVAIIEYARKSCNPETRENSADFLFMAYAAALGTAELANFRFCDINWGRSEMYLLREKTKKRFTCPVFPWIKDMLQARLAAAKEKPEFSDQDRVFGGILNPRKVLEGACEELFGDSTKFSMRDMRGGGICDLFEAGIPAKTLGCWQGHADRENGALIIKIYTNAIRSDDGEKEKAAIALGAAKMVFDFYSPITAA